MFDTMKRLGRFLINFRMIEDNKDVVKRLMAEMIVLRAEAMYNVHAIEYLAESDLFEECPESYAVPSYYISYDSKGGSFITHKCFCHPFLSLGEPCPNCKGEDYCICL